MKRTNLSAFASTMVLTLLATAVSAEPPFRGGVRIPAASCQTYPLVPGVAIMSDTGDLRLVGNTAIRVRAVCSLPVPERAVIRQVAMVGEGVSGEIFATLSAKSGNAADDVPFFAALTIDRTTAYEIPGTQQKATATLPPTGSESLTIDRNHTYYIEISFKTTAPIGSGKPLRLDYLEVDWN